MITSSRIVTPGRRSNGVGDTAPGLKELAK
ncbi:hypothetical protein V1279_005973 [Bradyrhizobium sp. AZCC 1610]